MRVLIFALALLPVVLGACSHSGEYFDIYGNGKKEWRLAFRGTANIGKSVYQAYTQRSNSWVAHGCRTADWNARCKSHYRNNDALDNFDNVKDVMFVIVKDGQIRRSLMFDGRGQNNTSWFSNKGFVSSCYHDLNKHTYIFGIKGHGFLERRFFVQKSYNGCAQDWGWFVAIDGRKRVCQWEKDAEQFPVFKFAPGPVAINWLDAKVQKADTIAVFLRY